MLLSFPYDSYHYIRISFTTIICITIITIIMYIIFIIWKHSWVNPGPKYESHLIEEIKNLIDTWLK